MLGKGQPHLTTVGEIDQRYRETCAQIGQSYLKRADIVSQLKSLDAELANLREAAHQHLAAYRAAQESANRDRDVERPMAVARD